MKTSPELKMTSGSSPGRQFVKWKSLEIKCCVIWRKSSSCFRAATVRCVWPVTLLHLHKCLLCIYELICQHPISLQTQGSIFSHVFLHKDICGLSMAHTVLFSCAHQITTSAYKILFCANKITNTASFGTSWGSVQDMDYVPITY